MFTLPGHREALPAMPVERFAVALGDCSFERFSNGELYLRLNEDVEGRACAVFGSLAPPDEQMLNVLLLAHTLTREGARRVVAVLPYLGYARQDQADPGQSLGAAWAGALLEAAGVQAVVTVDVHSREAVECLSLPVVSLSPAGVFAAALEERGLSGVTVVAPDEGAVARAEAVARAAGVQVPVAWLRKRRDAQGITHQALEGDVTPRVLIVDDILDTGGTLVSACRQLRTRGAREIQVAVTHGLFTGERWHELADLGVERIYTTDSIPDSAERGGEMVEVLPIGALVVDALLPALTAESQ